jgi:hypothetical protein
MVFFFSFYGDICIKSLFLAYCVAVILPTSMPCCLKNLVLLPINYTVHTSNSDQNNRNLIDRFYCSTINSFVVHSYIDWIIYHRSWEV